MIHLKTQKIIITTDFSETSLLAIKHGAFLAQFTKGEVYLVHIITKHWEKFNVFEPSISLENIEKASLAVETKLGDLANDIRKEYGVKVTTVVNSGNPTTEIVNFAKEIKAFSIHPYFGVLTEEFVSLAHQEGFQIHTWTVNSPEDITFVRELGVDAIISDFPDRL